MGEESPDLGAGVHVLVGPGVVAAFDFVEPDFGWPAAFHRRPAGLELIEGDLVTTLAARKLGDIFLRAAVDGDDPADRHRHGNVRSPAAFVLRVAEPFGDAVFCSLKL